MIKIMMMDILSSVADRNYSHIVTKEKEYLLSVTLKNIEEKLPQPSFMRIHRSYLANLMHIDEGLESDVLIGRKELPLGSGMRAQLMQRIQTL